MEDNSKIIFEGNLQTKEKLFDIDKDKSLKRNEKIKDKSNFFSKEKKVINKNKNDTINNNKKLVINNTIIKKIRNPGVDLLRIITMNIIIVHHIIFNGGAGQYFPQYRRQVDIWDIFANWHNGAFLIISGIVGYKTNKYSNLLYLYLTVSIYSIAIHKYIKYSKNNFNLTNDDINQAYYPMIFSKYWYFTSYFGMYLFLPVINNGIAHLTKGELILTIMSLIGILVIWHDYKNPNNDVFHLCNGDSIIWFLTTYLIGAFIGKYRVVYSGIRKYIYCLTCLFIYFLTSYLGFKVSKNELDLGKGYFQIQIANIIKRLLINRLCSLLRFLQYLNICLFFMQINYNKYLAKIICFFGPLVFGIYIMHMDRFIRENYVMNYLKSVSKNLSLYSFFGLIFLKAFKIFIICATIDYLRHLLFTLLRLKKIFIYIEKKIIEILNFNLR